MTTSLNNPNPLEESASNAPKPPEESAKPELNAILLADIWRAFVIYDRSATNAQKRFMFLRLLTLRLSVIVTMLAIVHSQFPNLLKFTINTPSWINFFPILANKFSPNSELIFDLLGLLVIIAPIAVSVLLAGTIKFGRGVSWILLRASAETIKQEIYRYRTQVGDYREPVNRDIHLAQVIQAINERLMKTQVNQGGLAWKWNEKEDKQDEKKDSQDEKKNNQDELEWKLLKISERESDFFNKRIKNAISKQDKYPFSALTAAQYVEYRLEDQLSWYFKKTLDLDKKWQLWQWRIYLLGGVGTFLAAMKWDVWIAVSNAIAASILSFLEFRRFDATLIGYNQTAMNLQNILYWWNALTEKEKNDPKNIEKLVENSEKVIRSETTGWVQEMKDAMADLYKMDEDRLAKEAEDAKKAKEAEDAKKAKEAEDAKKAKEAEDAKKAEETEKNGDKKVDGETKSVNLEEESKQEDSEPNLSSTDN